MTNFIGIDGSKNGWVGVQQNSEHLEQHELKFCKKLVDLITPELKLVIIDMPIGLEEYTQQGGRLVDREARKNLIKRKSSIFNAPCRGVLKARNYDEANLYSKKNGLGISKQSWNLVNKIKELDQYTEVKVVSYEDLLKGNDTNTEFDNHKGQLANYFAKNTELLDQFFLDIDLC